MNDIKKFLCENMPNRYQVCFTLERKGGKAVIAGEIVMCDCAGSIIAKSDMLYLPPRELYQAVEDISYLKPSKEDFLAALQLILEQGENNI